MVTATHDRRSDPRAGANALNEWGRRSAFGAATGWPWWAVVVLALGLSILGAFVDMQTSGDLGKVFEGAYFLGCVGAVCLVRRRNLFGPTVQPPLILAVTIPVVVLLTKGLPSGSGLTSKLLTLGVPLVTGFPTMAITTGATLLIGGIRFLMQRKPSVGADEDWGDGGDVRRRPADRGGERSGGGSGHRPNGGSGRPSGGRGSRDERDGQRERGRPGSGSRGRGEPGRDEPGRGEPRRGERSGREGRPAGGRSGSGADRDRDQGRDRDSGRGRKPGGDRGQSGRSQGGERGQSSRGGQSRGRGQAPRGERPSRDEGRRQPPPRRRDDDY